MSNINLFKPSRGAFFPHESAAVGDAMGCVLSFLPPEELAGACRVSQVWNRACSNPDLWAAFSPERLYPGCRVIGFDVWKRLGIDITLRDCPMPDNREVIPTVKRMLRHVEGGAGVTVLAIPKGMTPNELLRIATELVVPVADRVQTFFTEQGDHPVECAEVVCIGNNVISRSRNRSVAEQQVLLGRHGCEMPRVVQALALLILTFANSPPGELPIRLLSDIPWTYTRCTESQDGYPMVVGGFASSGLRVIVYYFFVDHEHIGVVGLRKFGGH